MADPRILISNDDGINSAGILALRNALIEIGQVDVVAPITEMSAMGHAITISDPLKVTEVERGGSFFGYGIHGTPADCVKLAVNSDLVETPDLVISGINQGANLGVDIIYSGTVSAAYEGTILGIPSMAVSLASFKDKDFSTASRIARQVAGNILYKGLEEGTLLNVNVPPGKMEDLQGTRLTRQGNASYVDTYERRLDPRNRIYYWLSGQRRYDSEDLELDENAIRFGYVSITPLHYRLTNTDFLTQMDAWDLELGKNDA